MFCGFARKVYAFPASFSPRSEMANSLLMQHRSAWFIFSNSTGSMQADSLPPAEFFRYCITYQSLSRLMSPVNARVKSSFSGSVWAGAELAAAALWAGAALWLEVEAPPPQAQVVTSRRVAVKSKERVRFIIFSYCANSPVAGRGCQL